MNKFIATSCEFRLTEDNWENGEGKTLSVWHEDVEGSDTVEGILKKVPHLNKDYTIQPRGIICNEANPNGIFENDPVHEGDYSRFDGDLMVDVDANNDTIKCPTPEQWNKFTKNEVDLYNLHITIYIRKVANLSESDVSNLI